MKAIALISGGLDSILSAKLIERQGTEVVYLNFKIPFFHKDKMGAEEKIIENFAIDLKTVDISAEFLEMLKHPRYGFGSNMNPCIDCKILMVKKAKELMEKWGAKFVITGEVLGQRPMSQNRAALELIEKRSGLEGLLVRPLSAKLLEETIPEKQGWIDRKELKGLSGRGRLEQMLLSKELGVRNYPNPAGGCLLTDPEFSKRLKELIEHKEFTQNNVELLKVGRHLRLASEIKLIVGRNQEENQELEHLAQEGDYLFYPPPDLAGPTALGRGSFSDESIRLSCKIVCRYCDLNGRIEAEIIYRRAPQKEEESLKVGAIENGLLSSLRV